MIDPFLVEFIAWMLAWLLLTAAGHKLARPSDFLDAVEGYRLLPKVFLRSAGCCMIVIELMLGSGWLFTDSRVYVAIGSTLLFAIYALAMTVNILRGREDIDCGCHFGATKPERRSLTYALVLRNCLLAGVCLIALLPTASRSLVFLDYMTIAGLLIVTSIMLNTTVQLSRNAIASGRWRVLHHGGSDDL